MSAPIRFLGLAIIAYVGLRTASHALALQPLAAPVAEPAKADAATLPPGVPADMGPAPSDRTAQGAFPPYAQMPPGAYAAYGPYGPPPYYPYGPAGAAMPQPYMAMPYPMMAASAPVQRERVPVYYPVPYPVPAPTYAAAVPAPVAAASLGSGVSLSGANTGYAEPSVPLDQWPAMGAVGPASLGATQVTPGWRKGRARDLPALAAASPQRVTVDGWALLRPPREGTYVLDDPQGGLNPGIAAAGSLGGSQAGLRISWRPLSSVGVHLRASTALLPGGRSIRSQTFAGGEGSIGVSWQPLASVPVRLLAERRQRLGSALGGGRNAFSLLAEGGIYQRPLAYGFTLDGYGQAGVVGASRRDLFADGALVATTPFRSRFAIGGGLWGGVQPGLSRFDAGPRLSYQLRPGLRAHVDYRFRVTGNAQPASGPALTIAAGF